MFNEVTLIILGIIQGVIEWIPISSSGTLMLFMIRLLGLELSEALDLSIFLHIGTGAAALTYFRKDVRSILFKKTERILLNYLVISTIITGSFGLCLYLIFNKMGLQGEYLTVLIGFALILNGILQKSTHVTSMRGHQSLTYEEGILMGLVQGLSIIPGVSRSGITTSALIFKGFSASEALRISFLMSIPTIFASSIGLALIRGISEFSLGSLIISTVASFLSGRLSMGILLRIACRIRFWLFCMVLGLIAMIPLLFH